MLATVNPWTVVLIGIVVFAAIIFITAIVERSMWKYEDRGYRYILLEAGHVAQNLNLCATAMNLGSLNLGGFFDQLWADGAMLGADADGCTLGLTLGVGERPFLVAEELGLDQVGRNRCAVDDDEAAQYGQANQRGGGRPGRFDRAREPQRGGSSGPDLSDQQPTHRLDAHRHGSRRHADLERR
mgnify:CR=1 FL=1